MFKHTECNHYLPPSVSSIVLPAAPNPNRNFDCIEWLSKHHSDKIRNALSFKGPLFYTTYKSKITETCTLEYPSLFTFKRHAKALVFSQQCEGSVEEWEGRNTPLYYVPGLPRITRDHVFEESYQEH